MDFAPLPKGRLPQRLVNGLGQVDGGMHDPGPRLAACGPCWCGRGGPVRLAIKIAPAGFLALTAGILSCRARPQCIAA